MGFLAVAASSFFKIQDRKNFREELLLNYFEKAQIVVYDGLSCTFFEDGEGEFILQSLSGKFVDNFWHSGQKYSANIRLTDAVVANEDGWIISWGEKQKSHSLRFHLSNGIETRGPFSRKFTRGSDPVTFVALDDLLDAVATERADTDEFNSEVADQLQMDYEVLSGKDSILLSRDVMSRLISRWTEQRRLPAVLDEEKDGFRINEIAADGDDFHGISKLTIDIVARFALGPFPIILLSCVPPNNDTDDNFIDVYVIESEGVAMEFHGCFDRRKRNFSVPSIEEIARSFEITGDLSHLQASFLPRNE